MIVAGVVFLRDTNCRFSIILAFFSVGVLDHFVVQIIFLLFYNFWSEIV